MCAMAACKSFFASINLHCSFSAGPRKPPKKYISKLVPLRAVAQPPAPVGNSKDIIKATYEDKIGLFLSHCLEILHEPDPSDGIAQIANLLHASAEFSRIFWSNIELSNMFITLFIQRKNYDAAEALLLKSRPSCQALIQAVYAFADKKSIRGVRFIQNLAMKRFMLTGPQSVDLWFTLIKAYGTLEKLDLVKKSFKSARESRAWTLQHTKQTNIYLNALHTDVNLVFQRARQLLNAGAVPDIATFNILLKACMRAKDGERADVAMEWLNASELEPDAVTWSTLIKVRSYTNDFEGVLHVRDLMESSGFTPTPDVWGSLLVACGAASHHETALMIWREAKTALGGASAIPVNLYNAMLTACNACGQGERTLSLLEEMKTIGIQPNVKSYNMAIKACEGRGGHRLKLEHVAVALKLYEEMRSSGMQPDLVTYGTLIELCAEGRQGALARRLRDRMDEDGVKPNVVVMTSLLKALARAHLIEDCLDTFSKMVWGPARVRPNRVTFRTLIRELREAGALGPALKTYQGMRKAHHAPSNIEFQELIAAAAEAALAEGDPELQAQVASLCNINETTQGVVDLHGMSSLESRAAVLCILSMLMTQYHETGLPPESLTLIVGKGTHSDGGKPLLPSTVMRLLSDELHLSAGHSENSGRIYIESEQLLRWVRARVGTRQQHQRARAKSLYSSSLQEFN